MSYLDKDGKEIFVKNLDDEIKDTPEVIKDEPLEATLSSFLDK